jgi:cellulose synthase/poly-beta-1,6-N-acetylglucosamine synthase-like glycosyltransferase
MCAYRGWAREFSTSAHVTKALRSVREVMARTATNFHCRRRCLTGTSIYLNVFRLNSSFRLTQLFSFLHVSFNTLIAVQKMALLSFRACLGAVVVAGTIITLLAALATRPSRNPTLFRRVAEAFQKAVLALLTVEFVTKVLLWIKYRPIDPVKLDTSAPIPSISVVIPAYNESAFVRNSIRSVLLSDYPQEKLELIVVDDGSTDDTWWHINEAVKEFDHKGLVARCRVFQHATNMGKRQAIRTGFMMVRGEIIVSLDSDSVLERHALRALVAPFMRDENVGGVAGHLAALNVESAKSTIPRLLDILFEYGGNIPRTAQSATGFVAILPGALSAFRTAAVQPHVDGLCARRFLGEPLRHGEDVELTFLLLRDGWRTVYQSNAVVHTAAPESPHRAMLMYTRWERSSYVYFAMGYLSLAAAEAAMCLSLRGFRASTAFPDKEKQEEVRRVREGSVYPALNMLCTAVANPFLILCFIAQIVDAFIHPERIWTGLAVLALLSVWRSLLFVADALDGDTEAEVGTSDVGGVRVYDRAARLVWRLQYSFLASCFQMVYVSWSSVFGLLTLKSQSWLTR